MQVADIFVGSPQCIGDHELAIGACRAGARGLIWAKRDDAWETVLQRCKYIAEKTTAPFGIQCERGAGDVLRKLSQQLPDNLRYVLVDAADLDALGADAANAFTNAGGQLFCRVSHVQDFARIAVEPIAGIILKGNESGGPTGAATAFILLQQWHRFVTGSEAPTQHPDVWVQGGIGLHTAAAARVGGARGVLLDSQLLLSRESPLTESERQFVRAMDGSESVFVGSRLGHAYRLSAAPGSMPQQWFDREQELSTCSEETCEEKSQAWEKLVEQTDADWALKYVGQDVALAAGLADRHVTVAGIVQAISDQATVHARSAAKHGLLSADSRFAKAHEIRYPILQGPMTRVSDTAAFADRVAEAGGLPFLALALNRGPDVSKLLHETKSRLSAAGTSGGRSWGVGLLGFLPPEVRQEQTEAILACPPPYALIAGGRPDQALQLEEQGISTYLHVPSPALLRMFLRQGARRFVFEGRECGGHVGPRTSFVLWQTMIDILLQHVSVKQMDDLHVVFAGGIHDDLSAAMTAAMAGELAERGVHVGFLMGTAYLFTKEAVESGAIVAQFQEQAISAEETVLFETGPGHAIRCVETPYFAEFEALRQKLTAEGTSHAETIAQLERRNVGRLRVASKGVDRVSTVAGAPRQLAAVPEADQRQRGMYMMGQVASLRSEVVTIETLHDAVSGGGTRRLEQSTAQLRGALPKSKPAPSDVAIVGMSCFYPGAGGLQQYWENILNRKYAVTEVPGGHWDWRSHYDPDPRAKDKSISKWGGFLADVEFDPLQYGITPKSVLSIEPLQLLLLEAVSHAIRDAGYEERPFDRERTCAILGIGGGGSPLALLYGFRACLPMLDTTPNLPAYSPEILTICDDLLPEWTEDSFPGFLMSVAVGRVANRFDFGGSNYAVDAACASSLAAVHASLRELESGTADVAFAMGADTVNSPYAYVSFSKTHALSARGRCRPFDEGADGIVLSEGVGVTILKRLADAERDGDRIYAVIRGAGSSSDGKDKGLTAPNAIGQRRALQRAYEKASVSPKDVSLVEAHGTGTVVGDRTEAESLATTLAEAGADLQSCALGSVKSMIGHTKCAAGIGGLIKTTLALHHKVLPPTMVDRPNQFVNFPETPLYLNAETRPWIHDDERPRRAGVSAFGFGGTNVHVVLEEYRGDFLQTVDAPLQEWPSELFVWSAAAVSQLTEQLAQFKANFNSHRSRRLVEVAGDLWKQQQDGLAAHVLAIVANSHDHLWQQLDRVTEALSDEPARLLDPRGVYYASHRVARSQLAMLFPGQGAQYPNMLADVAVAFPEVRRAFDDMSSAGDGRLERALGRYIYPPSTFNDQDAEAAAIELAKTEVAQPALGAASMGVFRLLRSLGVHPDAVAGHSYGEYVALWAAGVLSKDELVRLSYVRGAALRDASESHPGGMVAVQADENTVATAIEQCGATAVTLANFNAPDQIVVSGDVASLRLLESHLADVGIGQQRLRAACAFHSPAVASATATLEAALASCAFGPGKVPVYANETGMPYDTSAEAIRATLSRHVTSPVRFREQIESMHAAGARIFVEVGPQTHLIGLVRRILGDRDHECIGIDARGANGITQLQKALGQLLACKVDVNLAAMFRGRVKPHRQRFQPLRQGTKWVINGVRCKPKDAPEPRLLGQAPEFHGEQPRRVPSGDPASVERPRKPNVAGSPSATTAGPQTPFPHPREDNQQMPEVSDANSKIEDPPVSSQIADQPTPLDMPPGSDSVMLGFQQLMAKFLDTQRAVMLQYLGAEPDVALEDAPHPDTAISTQRRMAPAQLPESNGDIAQQRPSFSSEPSSPPAAAQDAARSPAYRTEPPSEEELDDDKGAPTPEMTIDTIRHRLVHLISERTGYPEDMLEPDLDLEGDLGIDSIKRVEILGELAEGLDGLADREDALELEKLTGKRTLRGMLDYLDDALFGENNAGAESSPNRLKATNAETTEPQTTQNPRHAEIRRGLVRLVDANLPVAAPMIPNGSVLMTDDQTGVAVELAEQFGDFGISTAVVRHVVGTHVECRDGVWMADLTQEGQVDELVESIKASVGNIAGLVHLEALNRHEPGAPHLAASHVVRSFYLLCRALEDCIGDSAESGNAFVLAASCIDGALGYDARVDANASAAGHGGLLGFAKCAAMEWPKVMVRAVDLSPELSVGDSVRFLLAELSDPDGPLEVGQNGERRVTWEPFACPLESADDVEIELNNDSVVLLTGGARGITAAIAQHIARETQATLILVGRSPVPEVREDESIAGVVDASELKAMLIARRQERNEPVAAADVEQEFQRIVRDREIRATLDAIGKTGSQVEYRSVDVRDEASVIRLLEEITSEYGQLTGVIHGAGVIEDKLIRDKTPQSFDRVFETKVHSAFHLARHLDPKTLKFCLFFASIASRFGNRGQSDYAAANEVLSKLAGQLDKQWPARVASIAWGPWAEIGMVSYLERHLTSRGVSLIPPAVGSAHLFDEILRGRKGDTEVLIAGGAENLISPIRSRH